MITLREGDGNTEQMPDDLLQAISDYAVPILRRELAKQGMLETDGPSDISVVSAIEVNGIKSLIQVTVTLSPDLNAFMGTSDDDDLED